MNRTYRLVWNVTRRIWMVVAECVRTKRKQAAGGLLLASAGAALAAPPAPTELPTGGQVTAGQAIISQSGVRMDINQSSQRAVIDWQTFNVGSQAHVNFNQPSSSSVTLNRVLDTQPSQIFGRITANGQVFLTNPNGVYFSPNASVDVGALVATTHRISNGDFMAGRYLFNRDGANGSVTNEGQIKSALGGYIALLAPEVRNQGVIVAQMGTVALAAGEAYELQFDGNNTLANLRVDPATIKALVDNRNAVQAPGGLIILSAQAVNQVQGGVVNNSGAVEATGIATKNGRIYLDATDGAIEQQGSLSASSGEIDIRANNVSFNRGTTSTASSTDAGGIIRVSALNSLTAVASHAFDASGTSGGRISLLAGVQGSVLSSAQMTANGTTGSGGTIELTGDGVTLLNAPISARGASDGGTIHLGGGWQGKGSLTNANTTTVGAGSTLDASSSAGQGGEIVVWSQDQTVYLGSAQAVGTSGGRIEISSKGNLGYNGNVNAGVGGTVLFDPKNLTIANPTLTMTWLSTLGGPNAGVSEQFGRGIAIDGNLLAIGAPNYNSAEGRVYLYNDINTTPTLRVTLSSGAGATSMPTFASANKYSGNYFFGKGLAINNGLLAVGAPYHSATTNGAEGGVLLFTGVGTDFSGLTYSKTLTKSTGATSMPAMATFMQFGWSIDIDNGNMGVGAFGNGNPGALFMFNGVGTDFSGLTYKWFLDNTTKPAALTTDLTTENRFGSDIDISGDNMIVGSTGFNSYGAAYMFSGLNTSITNSAASQLTFRKQLSSATGIAQDSYGQSVALYGDYILVGTGRNQFVVLSGANNVFSGSSTTLTTELIIGNYTSGSATLATNQPALANSGNFGAEVAINSSGRAVIGDYGRNTTGEVQFMSLAESTGDAVGTAVFATNAAASSTIFPSAITTVLNAGSNLTLQANNDITVSAAITANNTGGNGGNLTLQAGRSITVNQGITTDNGNLTLSAGDASADAGNRDAGTATITVASSKSIAAGSGNLSLTADAFSISGTLSGSGTLLLKPATANTTIGLAGGAGSMTLTAGNFSTNFSNGFSGITIGSGTAGAITVGGALTLNDNTTFTSGGAITLNAALNGSGQNITLNSGSGATVSGSGNITGANLAIDASGTISLTGAHTISGTTDLTAGAANNITLSTATNNFTGGVRVVSGNDVSLRDTNALVLGNANGSSAVSGNLTVVAGGAITQAGALTVGGTSSVTAGANAITLDNASNDFTGAVSLSNSGANNVSLRDANALALGTLGLGSGTLTLQAGGAITQTGAITQAAGGGAVSITAGANAITLANASNDFTGAVSLSNSGANNVSLRDSNALALGTLGLGSGTLTLQSAGAITQTGAITQAASGGAISISAGGSAITLSNTGNDFTGTLGLSNAANIALLDADTLTLGAINNSVTGAIDIATTTGNLTVSQNIATSDTSASAIKFNAGKSAAPGTTSGGDIVISNGASVTPGTGGFAALYTGSIAGSTGLESLIGAGSGRFRYNADETTPSFSPALSAGTNAVYRAPDPTPATTTTTTTSTPVILPPPPPPPPPPSIVIPPPAEPPPAPSVDPAPGPAPQPTVQSPPEPTASPPPGGTPPGSPPLTALAMLQPSPLPTPSPIPTSPPPSQPPPIANVPLSPPPTLLQATPSGPDSPQPTASDMLPAPAFKAAVTSLQQGLSGGGTVSDPTPASPLAALVASQVDTAIARGMPTAQAEQAGKTYNQALVQNLSKGIPMSEAVAMAEKVFQAEASFPPPKSPQEAAVKNLVSTGADANTTLNTLANNKTAAGNAAFDKALGVALLKGMSFDAAVKSAQSAVVLADQLARVDASPKNALASGANAADQFADTSSDVQKSLGTMLAKGVPLNQATARATALARDAARSARADRNNPASGLATGDLSLLDGRDVEGSFGKVLSVALAKGLPVTEALGRANQADAIQQRGAQADARSELTGFSAGKGNLPQGDTAFDRALTSAINRGASPERALAIAKQTVEAMPKDVQTASTSLASGKNIDTLLSSPGNSRAFKTALGNALAKGVPVAKALAIAQKAEAASAFRFPLSGQAARLANAKGGKLEITLADGKPLPSWLRYAPETKTFIASDVPDGAFPLPVVLSVAGQQAKLTISEGTLKR